MLAIPLPFVASLLLFIAGVVLRCRYPQTSQKPFRFIMLCVLMMMVVVFEMDARYCLASLPTARS